jgi:methionyl-tRNA formyltransferase
MEMINFPSLGTIQYHPSLLPLHRGPSSINWPIINGETETGLTIFWPDAGLDTGPVLMQKKVEIADEATLGSVYFNKLYPIGVQAMVESVDLVRSGDAPRIVQDETKATYESWCKASDVVVDWSGNVDTVFNMIRGADPQPGAGAPSLDDLSPEERAQAEAMAAELAEARERLADTPSSMVVANHAMGLYELGAIHLSNNPPNLSEAKVAIDAMAAIVDALPGRLGEHEETLHAARAQIQMAFVELSTQDDET